MEGWLRPLLLLLLLLAVPVHLFTLKLQKFSFKPVSQHKFKQFKPVKLEKLTKAENLVPHISKASFGPFHFIGFVLKMDFNYSNTVPDTRDTYFRLPMVSENYI